MGFKENFAKGFGAVLGFAGCMAYAGWLLGGLILWAVATMWYAQEWGVFVVLANIILMPIFTLAFPFIFWIKEGILPWPWLIIFVGMLVVQWGIGFAIAYFTDS